MTNYEKIKNMSIDEMAEFIVQTQIITMIKIKNTLVKCLPMPTETELPDIIKQQKEILESEEE